MAAAGMKELCLEASSDITLRPGGEYRLTLGSSGSSGYTWEFEILGPQGVVVVRPGPQGPVPEIQPYLLQTWSVDEVYVIEATGPGRAEVRFSLKRPGEKENPAAQVKSFRVTVTERE